MKKKLISIVVLSMILFNGCTPKYEYYSKNIIGPFDTVTTYITYAKSEEDFKEQYEFIEKQLEYYDHLFDRYSAYDDMNNIHKINENAGKSPVKVDQPLIDLLKLSIQRSKDISNKVNIAFGSVIEVWHDYREEAEAHDGVGKVPSKKELNEANKHTSLDHIVIDEENQTVYIKDSKASIDLGATAKGYAIELVKQDLIKKGVEDFLLSGGGNVASHGQRKIKKDGDFLLEDCKDKFCVSLQSPGDGNYYQSALENNDSEGILVVQGESIVTSGDYQRFYKDNQGIRYHHLIDPDTLYPSIYFRSVSIITEDSGLADFLSSAVFLMPFEDGLKLINSLDGVEAIWMLENGKIRYSDGLKDGQQIYIFEKDKIK